MSKKEFPILMLIGMLEETLHAQILADNAIDKEIEQSLTNPNPNIHKELEIVVEKGFESMHRALKAIIHVGEELGYKFTESIDDLNLEIKKYLINLKNNRDFIAMRRYVYACLLEYCKHFNIFISDLRRIEQYKEDVFGLLQGKLFLNGINLLANTIDTYYYYDNGGDVA